MSEAQVADPDVAEVSIVGLLSDVDETLAVDGEVAKEKPRETALVLDAWSIRQGERLAESSDDVRHSLGIDSVADREQSLVVADLRAAAWDPEPRLHQATVDPRRGVFVRALLESAEFQELRHQTVMNDYMTELAVARIGGRWAALAAMAVPGSEVAMEAQALKIASEAVKEAADEVQTAADVAGAFGVSKGVGGSGGMDQAGVASILRRMRDSRQLREIIKMAGRYRRLAASRQRTKPFAGREEFYGVEQGNDIGRLVSAELALLSDPATEDEFFRRFAEAQLQCYELRSVESEAMGPVVVCVDESGSMGGDRIVHAKAISLAVYWVCKQQDRPCWLASFSSGTEGARLLPIPVGGVPEDELLRWVEGFIGGGTTLDVPLGLVPAKWTDMGCPPGKTDMLIITDACVGLPSDLRESFMEWKAASRCHVTSIVIAADAGALRSVSDSVHTIAQLGVEVEAVGEVLSL